MGPPPVTVARPLVHPLVEWDRYTGRLTAVESVEVRSRVSGYLHSIHFVEGSIVKKGDPLFVIDPRPFEAEVARNEALVAEADARFRSSNALLVQAEARQRQAVSQRDLAKNRLERARKALETNAIPAEEFEVRESELEQSVATLESAKAAIALAKAGIETSRAGIESAKAALEKARLDLSYTKIDAPLTGRIGVRRVTRGNWVDGGSISATLLTSIVTIDPIHVTFDANEQAYLKYVKLSRTGARASSRDAKNPVYARLIDEQGYPHAGHMDFVDNQIDPATGTIRGRAIFRNPNGKLTPGLFAVVRIPGSGRYEAVLIPDEAIGANQAERFVLVVDDEGIARPQAVTLGPLVDGLRIIRSGLTGGERVVIKGLQRVRPGSRVTPKEGLIERSPEDDGLPDEYRPLPESEWIRRTVDPTERTGGEGK